MSKKMYDLKEVFVPVGLPDITFVKRETLERSIKAWEINQHKHLLIYGASKTGKTSLWKRYIAPEKVIKVPCNSETTVKAIYREILENIGAFFIQNETITSEKKKSILGEIKAFVPWLGMSAKLDAKTEEAKTNTQGREFVMPDLNASIVIKFLQESGKIIIIEDFHYTPEPFRQQLSQDLKAFSDEKCPWIIVGVQHKTTNLLSYNVDLSQRIAEIPVENFSPDKLREIIELGELALNICFGKDIKGKIIAEANGSGSIVQNICQRICMIKGIYNTQDSEIIITEENLIEQACKEIAAECKSFYEKAFTEISKGGRSDGSTEKYKWFLKLVATKDIPESGLKNTDIFHLLQEMGHSSIDQSSVTSGLKYLPTLLKKNNLPALLDYNETNKSFYLLDNYMKFVIKWIPELIDTYFQEK